MQLVICNKKNGFDNQSENKSESQKQVNKSENKFDNKSEKDNNPTLIWNGRPQKKLLGPNRKKRLITQSLT